MTRPRERYRTKLYDEQESIERLLKVKGPEGTSWHHNQKLYGKITPIEVNDTLLRDALNDIRIPQSPVSLITPNEKFVRDAIGDTSEFPINSTYSGSDIKVMISFQDGDKSHMVPVGSLQTISISSMRSIDPVRNLGITMAKEFTRGPRTVAGSLVFTDINYEFLGNVYKYSYSKNEKFDGGLFIDQLKEFAIYITCMSESGKIAYRYLHGVNIGNYGTTYSIDNMLTESTYTYVAKWVSPLFEGDISISSISSIQNYIRKYVDYGYRTAASTLR